MGLLDSPPAYPAAICSPYRAHPSFPRAGRARSPAARQNRDAGQALPLTARYPGNLPVSPT
ncbi:hypothetical protein E2562_026808 [Oryza meyeriana var. granulata]|uniref:Uncharacterized protein n=1 Tax=Oryza meyeriana var. granulata TaxID=110450 RepID=A0A6G1CIQ7_9ORYZ|nr:hypothetical protein E2562_026808 [Oryza meyeriana var. granulata]